MNRGAKIAAVALGVAVTGLLVWRACAPRAEDADVLSGYIEGDTLYLGASAPGPVGQVFVARGQRVAAGARLFALDPAGATMQQDQARAGLDQAAAAIGAAQARAGQARADLAAAQASETGARKDLARYLSLQRSNPLAVAAQQVDAARAAADAAMARRQAARQALDAASAQIATAQGAASQARAALGETDVRLGQLAGRAPAAGRIEDVFFQPGEWVAANQPVVSLLPDNQVKLRFFVPEHDLQLYRPGKTVSFACDGCASGLGATISYVSPRPEFTPPVIYSRKSRDKLVFLVEARPAAPGGLAPGLPIDVTPLAGARR